HKKIGQAEADNSNEGEAGDCLLMRSRRAKDMTAVEQIRNGSARAKSSQGGRNGRNPKKLDESNQEPVMDARGDHANRRKGRKLTNKMKHSTQCMFRVRPARVRGARRSKQQFAPPLS